MANLRMAVITYEHENITLDPKGEGPTIGQQVDNMLETAWMEHRTITEVAFEVDPEEWHQFMSDRDRLTNDSIRKHSRKA